MDACLYEVPWRIDVPRITGTKENFGRTLQTTFVALSQVEWSIKIFWEIGGWYRRDYV